MTVHFIGAGPGAPDLITVRGRDLIARCPVCLYAGSIVPKELLAYCPQRARIGEALLGDSLLAVGAHGLDACGDDPRDQQYDHRGDCGDGPAVAAQELSDSIPPRLRCCDERPAVEIRPYVVGKFGGAAVPLIALLAHGHERNPLQLAAQPAGQ